MKTIEVKTSWHKANDKFAMSYKQYEYIKSLKTDDNCDWPFTSASNAMRSLTKRDASEIIDALNSDNKVIIQ